MAVKITKEVWEKCAVRTVIYYKKAKGTLELRLKMSDIEEKLYHSNIADPVLKRIEKYYGKKINYITEKEKQIYKTCFNGKTGVYILEKLGCDLIEGCKLPKALDFRKKLGYNHSNILVREEQSIASKIIKLFSNEKNITRQKR